MEYDRRTNLGYFLGLWNDARSRRQAARLLAAASQPLTGPAPVSKEMGAVGLRQMDERGALAPLPDTAMTRRWRAAVRAVLPQMASRLLPSARADVDGWRIGAATRDLDMQADRVTHGTVEWATGLDGLLRERLAHPVDVVRQIAQRVEGSGRLAPEELTMLLQHRSAEARRFGEELMFWMPGELIAPRPTQGERYGTLTPTPLTRRALYAIPPLVREEDMWSIGTGRDGDLSDLLAFTMRGGEPVDPARAQRVQEAEDTVESFLKCLRRGDDFAPLMGLARIDQHRAAFFLCDAVDSAVAVIELDTQVKRSGRIEVWKYMAGIMRAMALGTIPADTALAILKRKAAALPPHPSTVVARAERALMSLSVAVAEIVDPELERYDDACHFASKGLGFLREHVGDRPWTTMMSVRWREYALGLRQAAWRPSEQMFTWWAQSGEPALERMAADYGYMGTPSLWMERLGQMRPDVVPSPDDRVVATRDGSRAPTDDGALHRAAADRADRKAGGPTRRR